MSCRKFKLHDRVLVTGAESVKNEYRWRQGIIANIHASSGVYTVKLINLDKELVLHDDELQKQQTPKHDDLTPNNGRPNDDF